MKPKTKFLGTIPAGRYSWNDLTEQINSIICDAGHDPDDVDAKLALNSSFSDFHGTSYCWPEIKLYGFED